MMILATNLCLLWFAINFLILIPRKLSKEEMLFLFLTSSIAVMLAIYFPAHKAYYGVPGFKLSLAQFFAFLINRNCIFPLLTIIYANLIQSIKFYQHVSAALLFIIIITFFISLEEKYTTVTHVPFLIFFEVLYLFLISCLIKSFRLIRDSGKKESI